MLMKLETYLKKNSLTDDAFASVVSLSQSQVSRIKRGVSWPSSEVIERITTATKGKVSVTDLWNVRQEFLSKAKQPEAAS